MSPDGCPGLPDTGPYYISTSGLCVGNQQVGNVDNIVVNDKKTAFYLRWLHKDPCTYEINLGNHQDSGQFVRSDKEWINIPLGRTEITEFGLIQAQEALVLAPTSDVQSRQRQAAVPY